LGFYSHKPGKTCRINYDDDNKDNEDMLVRSIIKETCTDDPKDIKSDAKNFRVFEVKEILLSQQSWC